MMGRTLVACLLAALCASASAQGTREDYARARAIGQLARNKIFRQNVRPQWLPDQERFWYKLATGPSEHTFVFVDAKAGERQPAFDHVRLAQALGEAVEREVDADRLPLERLTFAADNRLNTFAAFGKTWKLNADSYGVEETEASDDPPAAPRWLERSKDSDEHTYVRFVNRSRQSITLIWLDRGGNRTSYGVVKPGQTHRQHTFAGHVWLIVDQRGISRATYEATAGEREIVIDDRVLARQPPRRRGNRPRTRDRSPDGKYRALIDDHNVVIQVGDSEEKFRLTEDGSEQNRYESRFYWSPDSTRLVVFQVEAGSSREVHLIESSPKDQLQPKLHTLSYTKPGDRLPHPRPCLFDLAARKQIAISDEHFANPWSIDGLRWSQDSKHFGFLYNQRGHQVLRWLQVNAATGEVRVVVDEVSETFIDYAGKKFLHHVEESGELIWMSERDGWNHLYLVDTATGEAAPMTSGPWVVRGVERVDEALRQVWFRAGGIHGHEGPDAQSPYHVHLCRVNFDGSGLTRLTQGDGTHRWEFSPDGRYLLDRWSRVDQPPVTELRSAEDGRLICALEEADWSRLKATGWRLPERFVSPGRDGKTPIHGILIRPTNFDPAKRYPVVEKIYAGPHSAHVPIEFGMQTQARSIAELGFIVVQIDGMGTSHRSKAFHDVCWKNLADAGFPDRIAWMQAAAKDRPEMDLRRVGIYGGSAGGQNALGALLSHGDFYKVAVADCGCHDNRMDKIWWNELWMGWPIGPHYQQQSNVTRARQLQGKLLLIVGELDRNVDPASTMQVVDALVKADKDFDLLIMPGVGHGAAERPYGSRRRMDFLVRHLWNRTPREPLSSDGG